MENYYELLEVSKNASNDVISKVFKYHIKKNHPDLFTGKEKLEAEVKVKKINEAYEVLSNPEKRKIYDEKLYNDELNKYKVKDEEIEKLKSDNNLLTHNISNYNRFIHEYFYENADYILNIINNYDRKNDGSDYNKVGIKATLKNYLVKGLFYIAIIFIFLTILSILFKINIFSIIINVLFK